ncbi:guanylate kinase [Mucisphaera calidilacus]|uniref:Guanylate kinase n=1 Tax=Mucisphaera calidilacus TaxID=2527982 RepID=A0A518BXR2_9BACT|nr:guanylate kinase [Mucisphaera calidilacus]QDU71744.1 Guanylate kinase [Mucisphaera calidilacus]
MNGTGLLVIISGPSGAGKTTIAHEVERRVGATFSVSMTTRAQTAKDVDGQDYVFVSDERFRAEIERGGLLEWAEVFGRCYGTPREPVERAVADGRTMLLEIDVQGAVQVKEKMPDALTIFILPPDEATLLQRLRDRKREGEDQIQKRFAEARREIALARESGAYDVFIVNDDLERAIGEAEGRVRERMSASG